jgi:predicted MFS family arabinose efflux permease
VRTAPLLFEFPIEAFSLAWFVVLPPIACVVAALVATTAWFAHAHAARRASAAIASAAAVHGIACVGVFGVVITDNAGYRLSAGYWLAAVSTCALATAIVTTRGSHRR